MTIEKIVGENINKHFKASGLNITHFARKISVQNGSYAKRVLSGEVSIGIGKLHKIANALDVSVLDLLEGVNELKKPVEKKEKPKLKPTLSKADKQALRKRWLSLIGTGDAWAENEVINEEVKSITRILCGGREHVKTLTGTQKQIIHLLKKGLDNGKVSDQVGCSREYVAVINRQLKNNVYEGYINDLYQVEVNILKLHSEGLDVREIANKLNIREDDVKNALEELEG